MGLLVLGENLTQETHSLCPSSYNTSPRNQYHALTKLQLIWSYEKQDIKQIKHSELQGYNHSS